MKTQVQEFYSKLKFPGPYSMADFKTYAQEIHNPFLSPYDNAASNAKKVLDIGCGSGFIVNLLAHRYPSTDFTALDFSDGIDYAEQFAVNNNLKNIKFIKEDFLESSLQQKFDLILCNGVLHHMPDYNKAVYLIKKLLANDGNLVIGLYNRYGKSIQKLLPITWRSDILYADQELVPFETSFSHSEILSMFSTLELKSVYPSISNRMVDFLNLFNYHNGCLSIYSFKNSDKKEIQ